MPRSTFLLLGAIFAGVAGGSLWPAEMAQVAWLGDLFLALLKLLVVPLVVTSMVAGIAGLGDVRRLGPVGGWTVVYYLSTTLAAVLLGLVLVNVVQPGQRYLTPYDRALKAFGLPEEFADVDDLLHHRFPERRIQKDRALQRVVDDLHLSDDDPRMASALDAIGPHRFPAIQQQLAEGATDPANALRDIIDLGLPEVRETLRRLDLDGHPDLARRLEKGEVTPLEAVDVLLAERRTGPTDALKSLLFTLVPPNLFQAAAETNILALILFSLVFGGVCTTLGSGGAALLDLFRIANEAIMKMVHLVMAVAPVGIFALVAGKIAAEGGGRAVADLAVSLAAYGATVAGGLLLHGLVVLPLILRLVGRRSPVAYGGMLLRALVTAFATASSSATLPISMECVEEGGVRPRSARFVLPLGATINMDGTALYEAVAVMFIAQVYGIPMGPTEQVIIFLTATLAAIGAAGIPEAGLVTMVMVLSAVHLPVGGMALILTIDWLLDRLRTTVNVWGDAVGAAVIDRVDAEGARD